MASTSGSITTSKVEGCSVTLSWSRSAYNVINNTSTLSWNLKASGGYSGWVSINGFSAVIDGRTVVSKSSSVHAYSGNTLASGSITLTHNTAGAKSFSASCSANIYYYGTAQTASGSWTLPTIPRASSIEVTSSIALGGSGTITISRASSSFTHTLTYSFAGATGTIATKTTATSVTFSPDLSLAQKIPNATSGTCTITCTTYNGTAEVGKKSTTCQLTVPASVKPTISEWTVTAAEQYDLNGGGAHPLAGYSKLSVSITAAGAQGSSISSYSSTFQSTTYSGASFDTGIIVKSGDGTTGTATLTTTVTDSRGRTATHTETITFYNYEPPTITTAKAYRSDDTGAESDIGAYMTIFAEGSVFDDNSPTREVWAVQYRQAGAEEWTTVTDFAEAANNIVAASDTSTYEVQITLKDNISTDFALSTSLTINIPAGIVTLDFLHGGAGMAIGKTAEKEGLDIAWDTYIKDIRYSLTEEEYDELSSLLGGDE